MVTAGVCLRAQMSLGRAARGIWLSDSLAFNRIVSIPKIFKESLNGDESDVLSRSTYVPLSDDFIDHTWERVSSSPKHYRQLFDKVSKASQAPAVDMHKRYAAWISRVIYDVLREIQAAADPPHSITNSQVNTIRKRLVDYTNFELSDNARKLIKVLEVHRIPWGVLSNHGPYFDMIVKNLKRHEQQNILEAYRINLRQALFISPFSSGLFESGLYGMPSSEFFSRVKQLFDNKPQALEPLPHTPLAKYYYFLGSSSCLTDHNVQGLMSLGVRSIIVNSPHSPTAARYDSPSTDLNEYFVTKPSVNDVYSTIFGEELGDHYSTMSLDELAALSADMHKQHTAQRNKCLPLTQVFGNQDLPKSKARMGLDTNTRKEFTKLPKGAQVAPHQTSVREMGLSDLGINHPSEKKRVFTSRESLKPIH